MRAHTCHGNKDARTSITHVTSVASRLSAKAVAPASPILLESRYIVVMVSLAFQNVCVCERKPNDGNHLTAPTLYRTMTHLRSPRSSHIFKSVNVANYHECRASEEVCHTPRSRVLLVVRAVMWCGVVAYDGTPCRGDS